MPNQFFSLAGTASPCEFDLTDFGETRRQFSYGLTKGSRGVETHYINTRVTQSDYDQEVVRRIVNLRSVDQVSAFLDYHLERYLGSAEKVG